MNTSINCTVKAVEELMQLFVMNVPKRVEKYTAVQNIISKYCV
jgi:hypothetical protein